MTATLPPPTTGTGRTLRVALLHLVNPRSELGWPWAAVVIAFVPNALSVASVDRTTHGPVDVFGLLALYILIFVSFLAAMTQWFPFALGLGVTRTRFFAGLSALAIAQAAAFSVVLVALFEIEQATGGWWIDLRFFGPEVLVAGGPAAQFLVYLVPMVAASYLGMVWGIITHRWGRTGLILTSGVLFVASVAVSTTISWLDRWPEVSSALADLQPGPLLAGWGTVLAALLAATAYGLLRRSPV